MRKRFVAVREDRPGADWLRRFAAGRRETEQWYLGAERAAPPTANECRAALSQHMPGLLSQYDRVCALVGDDERAHQILSHYRPPPLAFGCTQAVWLGKEGPALCRNYDFPLEIVSDRFESTSWFGREVVAKAQRPWGGCLDGMNADGLCASATFGGSKAQGLGFSIILILRYVLETCSHVAEGVDALRRIPVALSQNVSLLDRSGAHATVFLGPDREPAVSQILACANHQDTSVAVEIGSFHTLDEATGGRVASSAQLRNDPGLLDSSISRATAVFARPKVADGLQRCLSTGGVACRLPMAG